MSGPGFDPPSLGDGLQAQMLAQRRVMISGTLDDATVTAACASLMMLDGQSAEPVAVIVNADGAELAIAFPLIDTLALMRTPLTVDVLGRAHGSAGIVVAGSPGARRIGPTATLSLRIGRPAPMPGFAAEIAHGAERAESDRARAAQQVAARTGRSVEWLRAEFDRGALHDGATSVDLGLVDEKR